MEYRLMIRNSEKIPISPGSSIYIMFTHTEHSLVIATITADCVSGQIRMARNNTAEWICLQDDLDRNKLSKVFNADGTKTFPAQSTIDIELLYMKYTTDLFVT
jgi:hypothetical protein